MHINYTLDYTYLVYELHHIRSHNRYFQARIETNINFCDWMRQYILNTSSSFNLIVAPLPLAIPECKKCQRIPLPVLKIDWISENDLYYRYQTKQNAYIYEVLPCLYVLNCNAGKCLYCHMDQTCNLLSIFFSFFIIFPTTQCH